MAKHNGPKEAIIKRSMSVEQKLLCIVIILQVIHMVIPYIK